MQAISAPASSPSLDAYEFDFNNNYDYSQLSANFAAAVKVSDKPEMEAENNVDAIQADEIEEDEDEEEEEEEFSFFCTNPDGSPISADDVFQDGQIRPVYPIFNRDLLFTDAYDGNSSKHVYSSSSSLRPPLKKLFFEDRDAPSSSASESDELEALPEGSYCEWSKNAKEVSPELKNNKSNSTGFSKLWRIRDLVPRSNSDGKDAFVFLNPNSASLKQNKDAGKAAKSVKAVEKAPVKDKGQKGKKAETVSSAHEKHYVMNRAKKEGDKRRSYLPYRPGVVGFFTNVNGLSRNVHPF
ncbi:uncharacterized protein LOC126792870 [Argentina anserina]|uniref:uncharacterized protein LOC126792870 n=1 Tax=Argentina anserina TaxID=57926 RepID=UPI0021764C19|nr:uncharacterized protein LOC126792870 [Potentilla anserina]